MYHCGGIVDNGVDYACVEARGIWEISSPSVQFFCESKITLKINLLKKDKLFPSDIFSNVFLKIPPIHFMFHVWILDMQSVSVPFILIFFLSLFLFTSVLHWSNSRIKMILTLFTFFSAHYFLYLISFYCLKSNFSILLVVTIKIKNWNFIDMINEGILKMFKIYLLFVLLGM